MSREAILGQLLDDFMKERTALREQLKNVSKPDSRKEIIERIDSIEYKIIRFIHGGTL